VVDVNEYSVTFSKVTPFIVSPVQFDVSISKTCPVPVLIEVDPPLVFASI
tara:strand:+ start:48 stop:197 length:150 start_codon:yes stop_codon:yes gene_type:complete